MVPKIKEKPQNSWKGERSYLVLFHEHRQQVAEFLPTGSESSMGTAQTKAGEAPSSRRLHPSVLATLTLPHTHAAPPNPETPQQRGLGAGLHTTVSAEPRTLSGVGYPRWLEGCGAIHQR